MEKYVPGGPVSTDATTRFVYDGWKIIEERTPGSGGQYEKVRARYGYGTSLSEVLWMDRDAPRVGGTGALDPVTGVTNDSIELRAYLHSDALGSVVAVTDTQRPVGTLDVIERFDYTAYGRRTQHTGAWTCSGTNCGYATSVQDGPSKASLPIGYTGHYWDGETGFWYARNRYYDDKQGRFVSRDPLGLAGGVSLYQYADSAPTARIDPLGLKTYVPPGPEGRKILQGWRDRWAAKRDSYDRAVQRGQIDHTTPFCGPASGCPMDEDSWEDAMSSGERALRSDIVEEIVVTVDRLSGDQTSESTMSVDPAYGAPQRGAGSAGRRWGVWPRLDPMRPPVYGGREDHSDFFALQDQVKRGVDLEFFKFARLSCSLAFGACGILSSVYDATTGDGSAEGAALAVAGGRFNVSGAAARAVIGQLDDIAARGATKWGKAGTLGDHFARHGADFGAKSADDYARMADDFFEQSQKAGLPTKIGPDGTIRVFDPASNTFGAFNPDGTTKTFFKPSSPGYFDNQPGVLLPPSVP